MTDAEILCGFMEKRPEAGPWSHRPWRSLSRGGWWTASDDRNPDTAPDVWFPVALTLDRLRLVEARLTDMQWLLYQTALSGDTPEDQVRWRDLIHASAEQKITALAAVLKEGR